MARDRQRSKQRKARRDGAGGDGEAGKANFPGPLNAASGEVEEFEAKLAADSGGPVDDAEAEAVVAAAGGADSVEDLSDEEFDELAEAVDDVEEAYESGDEDAIEAAEEDLDEEVVAQRRERAAAATGAPTKKGGLRFVGFLKASWAELQRVQWPDRRQVGQATAVVLGFVVVAGLYLGAADWVAKKIVDLII